MLLNNLFNNPSTFLLFIVAVVVLLLCIVFRIFKKAPKNLEKDSVQQQKTYNSLWFWWIFMSAICLVFSLLGYPQVGVSTLLGHVAGFFGLFTVFNSFYALKCI